jgi:hypothetical protein
MARLRKPERETRHPTRPRYGVAGEGLPVNDLHEVIMSNDHTRCLSEDGCHMTEFGNEVLSDTVVKSIGAVIAVC